MVADFIDEHSGFLCLTDQEARSSPETSRSARTLLEYGAERDGYWTGVQFMEQMKKACDIADITYPSNSHTVVFVLYQSRC